MKKGLAGDIPLLLTLGGVMLLLGSFGWYFPRIFPACDICVARGERAAERTAGRAAADKWTEAFASVNPGALKPPAWLELRFESPPTLKPAERRIF